MSPDILLSLITILITITLLYLYFKEKINIIELLFYSYATQTYNIAFIGSTITPFFFISIFFLINLLILFFQSSFSLTKKTVVLLTLPLLSSLIGFLCYTYKIDSFYYTPNGDIPFYLKPIYFYAKNYLPFFSIAYFINKNSKHLTFEFLFSLITKIAYFSSLFAILQITICIFTNGNTLINELIGNKYRYIFLLPNGLNFVRVSALFIEPKSFAAFLGLSLPILMYRKEYTKSIFIILIGLLTLSQTFMIECIIILLCLFAFKLVRNTRSTVFVGVLLIWGVFFSIATFKDFIIDSSSGYSNTLVFTLVLERALDRYQESKSMTGEDSQLAGIPMQQDLEWPIVKFFRDRPVTLLTGYGPGNSIFLQPKYFEEVYSYEEHKKGVLANHMNMRWFFYMAEFGIPIFTLFIWIFTAVPYHSRFTNFYYTFLWLCFFFNEIDMIIVIFYTLLQTLPTKPKS